MPTPAVYTIGYATKPIESFISQLKQHHINVIADVRSVPYSKVFHDYHREALYNTLKKYDIRYVYLGEELGPRSKDPAHYDESGQVQFHKLSQSSLFKKGIQRLYEGVKKGFNIAMMCAEKDPAVCHRSLLIGYTLKHEHNLELIHIKHDGSLEQQSELESRLVHEHDAVVDLFLSEADLEQLAYEDRLKATSYRKPEFEKA